MISLSVDSDVELCPGCCCCQQDDFRTKDGKDRKGLVRHRKLVRLSADLLGPSACSSETNVRSRRNREPMYI